MIKNDAEYEMLMKRFDELWNMDLGLGTPLADEFEKLSELLEAYETRRWPIPKTNEKYLG